jgi:hypothetical protein
MLNPFLQFPPEKTRKNQNEMNEELAAQIHAQPAKDPTQRTNLGLWAGTLLIKMGKKLAQQDIEMKTSKEHA